jgi:hypothetical protein
MAMLCMQAYESEVQTEDLIESILNPSTVVFIVFVLLAFTSMLLRKHPSLNF